MVLYNQIVQVVLIVALVYVSRCSHVIDSRSQNALYVANYCPTMKHCLEGTHVMCMYYNPDQTMGLLCKHYVTVTITSQMVHQILKEVNDIRMRVASGKETGKDGRPLPRAYGMMKMFWDSELATLAQVLADQCMGLREDECRATDTFPKPSQIITLINFKVPNWDYLSRNTTVRGLNKEKISFAIEKAMRSLHAVKRLVTPSTVYDTPALESIPDMGSRSYLKLIRGKATHIGCGISAYRRFQMLSSGTQNIYNSIQLVCNLSDEPQKSQPLYTTDPPIPGTGFTESCGCPQGYRETTGCLCERNSRVHTSKIKGVHEEKQKYEPPEIKEVQTTPSDGPMDGPVGPFSEGNPKVAILPIFEIQDVPPNSYEPDNYVEYQFHRSFGNRSFFPDEHSVEDTDVSNEISYKEVSNDMTTPHKVLRTNRLHNMPNKIHKKNFELHDVVISEELKPERYEIYNSVEHSIENDDIDSDRTFLSILDHLEKAVQDIELEGDARELFDIKMRKIYESGLKLKNQNVQPKTDVLLEKIKPVEREDHLQEVRNYLQHKTNHRNDYSHTQGRRHWPEDEKINQHTVEEKDMNTMDDYYPEQKETESDEMYKGIDDKLIDILNKKRIKNHKYDYYEKNYADEERYNDRIDEIEDNTFPPARKQENINRYEKNFKELNTENTIPENIVHKKHAKSNYARSKMEVNKKLNEELRLKHHGGSKQNKHLYDHTVQTVDIRPMTPHKNMKKKTRRMHKPSVHRQIIEKKHGPPAVYKHPKSDKKKPSSHKDTRRFFISRAML